MAEVTALTENHYYTFIEYLETCVEEFAMLNVTRYGDIVKCSLMQLDSDEYKPLGDRHLNFSLDEYVQVCAKGTPGIYGSIVVDYTENIYVLCQTNKCCKGIFLSEQGFRNFISHETKLREFDTAFAKTCKYINGGCKAIVEVSTRFMYTKANSCDFTEPVKNACERIKKRIDYLHKKRANLIDMIRRRKPDIEVRYKDTVSEFNDMAVVEFKITNCMLLGYFVTLELHMKTAYDESYL